MLPLVGCNHNGLRFEIPVGSYPISLCAAIIVELLIVVPFSFLLECFPTCWLIRLYIGVNVIPNARLG